MNKENKKILWENVKKIVDKRDKHRCRLIKVLSAKEYLKLKKNAKSLINRIDRAHILSRSSRPDLIFDSDNVVCLNHYSHSNLDNCCDPLDGTPITKEEVTEWWKIIAGEEFYLELVAKNKRTKKSIDSADTIIDNLILYSDKGIKNVD